MSEAPTEVCVNCGEPRSGTFCVHCGEKRIRKDGYALVHFLEHLADVLTHFDIRSLRSAWLLMTKPGVLTRDYLDGRRKRHVGPIQLFAIVNIVFALIGATTFRTPLIVQESDPPFAAMKRTIAANAIDRSGLTRQEFTREFDTNAGVQAKVWVFLTIPGLALGLAMLYGFRRYFFEHLVFATHLMAALLVLIIFLGFALSQALKIVDISLTPGAFDRVVSLLILFALIVYSYVAVRTVYADGRIAAALRAIGIGVLVIPVLFGYRFVLFFITLKTMH
jgi:Protein of unknown function (DUF3667)